MIRCLVVFLEIYVLKVFWIKNGIIFRSFVCRKQKIFTFEGIIFSKERCIVKKKRIFATSGWRNGRTIRKRFLLYPDTEIANFQQKDRDNSNAHSVFMYMKLRCSLDCILTFRIYSSVRILFLRSFLWGVWRCLVSMSRTSLTLSFYSYLIYIISWLRRLIY